jgi:hypothetical protein
LVPALPTSAAQEQAARAFLSQMNLLHLERSGGEAALTSRIRGFELAARMQLAVPRVARARPSNRSTATWLASSRRKSTSRWP